MRSVFYLTNSLFGIWTRTCVQLTGGWQRRRQIFGLLRWTAFDVSTDEGRSKERYRRVLLTALAALAARGIGIAVSLISVPITLNYLGTERYGLWMTISSVLALLAFADLGMGNGLLNAIAKADGEDDIEAAQKNVSSAFFMLLGIGSIIATVFLILYPLVPWPRVFNVNTTVAMQESGPAIAVLVAGFCLNMPLGIAQRIHMGYQEGYKNYLWQVVGSLLGLGGVLVAVFLKVGLPWLVLAMSGGPAIGALLNCVVLFGVSRPWLLPKWRRLDWGTAQILANTGVWFLVLQVLTVLGTASDNMVIAQILGASAVTVYAVTQRLFSITQIAQYFLAPLWPAFGEAMARSDYAWARRTLNRALSLSLGIGLFTAVPLVMFGDWIVPMWTRADVAPSRFLLIGLGLNVLLVAYGGVMSTFLNSGRLLNRQVTFFAAASISTLLLKIGLTQVWGVEGVIWATLIGFGVFYVVPAGHLAYASLTLQSPHRSAIIHDN